MDKYIEELKAELAEYKSLEANGLLLRLPVKLGTPVYRVYADDCGADPCYDYCGTCKYACCKIIPCKFNTDLISEWNKTVFLSEDKAKEVMKELKSKYYKPENDD